MRHVLLLTLLLGGLACGPHALDLKIAIAANCGFSVPAGGSLLYEVVVEGADGGASPRVCGACLTVKTAITDPSGLVALLQQSAPSCPIAHGASLHVRLTSFAGSSCTTAAAGPTSGRLCGLSPTVQAGSGQSDQQLTMQVSCAAGCDDTSCQPASCQAQGTDCDNVGDGCGNTLNCGTCKPPLRCGGSGMANVCGK